MFKSQRNADQTRIKLPKRSLPPTVDYLQFAFVQSLQYREKEVEITWTAYTGTKSFILVVRAPREKDTPTWSLWEENAQGSQLVWSAETSQLAAVEDKIISVDPVGKDLINNAQTTSQTKNPYRQMLSASYHGIRSVPQNSIRESFTRWRAISPPPTSPTYTGDNTISPVVSVNEAAVIENRSNSPLYSPPQVANAGMQQELFSGNAHSIILCKSILDEFTKLVGHSTVPTVQAVAENIVSGTLEHTVIQNKHLLKLIIANQFDGKLELINQDAGVAEIFFRQGVPYNATAVILDDRLTEADLLNGMGEIRGDQALIETVIWSPSSFKFLIGESIKDVNLQGEVNSLITHALGLRDELGHLYKAGFQPHSIMVKKQEGLGENELRLLLSKHTDEDMASQVELYKRLPKKFTVADLFEDGPAIKANWIPVIYRFFANGLIDIKAPLAVDESSLNFMEEGKSAAQALKATFMRKESGILSYPALLYFLQYEYLRFQTYDTPLSLIIFEMAKISNTTVGGLDLINKEETAVALQRLRAITRPLDFLGHFEAIDYALLLPNTNMGTAMQMAKHIVKNLTAQPLVPGLDPSLLKLSFGIGSIPHDCESLEELIILGKKALHQSKAGDFLIVQAGNVKLS